MPESQANVELVRRVLDAFNRGDVDAVIAAFDADCEIVEPPEMPDSPAVGYRGPPGIRTWMGNLRGVTDARFEARQIKPNGNRLLCELASTGLGQASGVPVEWVTYAVVEVRAGRIRRIQVFLSEAEARAAMPPASPASG
jgi:ketosteroid isomerase-like protein